MCISERAPQLRLDPAEGAHDARDLALLRIRSVLARGQGRPGEAAAARALAEIAVILSAAGYDLAPAAGAPELEPFVTMWWGAGG